jgi:Ser/Thr protein kinase RdoA (MazF antagonist)
MNADISSAEDAAVRSILDEWSLPAPRTLRQAVRGTNNLSRFVDTPAGSYLLRLYQNTSDPDALRHEHALLGVLQHMGLSFAVPLPLETRTGGTLASVAGGGVACLFPVIPGTHPERGSATATSACGEALGELDVALERVAVDPSLQRPGVYGDLYRVHPLVPNPLEMVRELPVPRADRLRLEPLFGELLALVPGLYKRLPRQTIHGDLSPGNVLMLGERVSGLLDFEFAGPDLRALDLAVGLWGFALPARGTGSGWRLVGAFARGYRRRVALERAEVEALPMLLRLRDATSLVHWAGRLRLGLTTGEDIARRARGVLELDGWLAEHGAELVRRVDAARPGPTPSHRTV